MPLRLLLICALLGNARSEQAPVVIDAAKLSPPFQMALSKDIRNVKLTFVSEDEVAVSYFDDFDVPLVAAREQRPEKHFHLLLDFYAVTAPPTARAAELTLDTTSIHSSIVPFATGVIISHGRTVTLLDGDHRIKTEASAESLCGASRTIKEPVDTQIVRTSKDQGVLFFSRKTLDPSDSQRPVRARRIHEDSDYCWFSPGTLKSTNTVKANLPAGDSLSARNGEVWASSAGGTHVVTQDSVRAAEVPCKPENAMPGVVRVLPLGDYSVLYCPRKRAQLMHGNSVSALDVSEQTAKFETASDAPVLAQESVTVHRTASGFAVKGNIEVLDYFKNKRLLSIPIEAFVQGEYYSGESVQIAVSPLGTSIAVLQGGTIRIYRIKQP